MKRDKWDANDDLMVKDLEAECLKPSPSDRLPHIGLQLLKYVSSHRGLTYGLPSLSSTTFT